MQKDKEYNFKIIKDNAVYANKALGDQLPELYYPISWKDYSDDKST